ncbi:hypothetical protein RIF29_16017 [Crotalaria pallida]|uniref:Heparanase-like protein 1 n=1 Tax=Crotalaria pallida TaxID=3830 RepID=A0AAN9IJI2_CROPI
MISTRKMIINYKEEGKGGFIEKVVKGFIHDVGEKIEEDIGFGKPTANVTAIHLPLINFHRVDIVVDVLVKNPNPVPIPLIDINYLVESDGRKLVSGFIPDDLNNEILSNALKAFGSLRIRLGGSLQDQMVYQFGRQKECPRMSRQHDGNELCDKGISARVESVQYANDMKRLKRIVNKIYPEPSTRPTVLGPGGFFGKEWFDSFLKNTGPGVLHGVTHHLYNLGHGVDSNLIKKVQDPFYLSQVTQVFKDVATAVKTYTPWAGAWVGESGGAYNSGGKDVSHTFANGFWSLGMASTFDHKVYCRQTLFGGNYALLNTTSFIPTPDYYGALLWHQLMGIWYHYAPHINMSNSTSFNLSLVNDMSLHTPATSVGAQTREEYHLTPKDGNIQSDIMLLNGTPLKLTESLDIPELKPNLVDLSSPIKLVPDSIVFVCIKSFKAQACS